MKKLSIIAGLGLLATAGSAFAAWSFGYTPTTFADDSLSVTISVDTEFSDLGMHGTLALTGAGIANVQIVQNDEKTSAKFNYAGSDVYTLTYTDPADVAVNPDPATYSFTVNAVVSSNLNGVGGITVSSTPIALTINQSTKTQTVSVADLLAKFTFPSITTEASADTFVAAVKGVASPSITFTFATAA